MQYAQQQQQPHNQIQQAHHQTHKATNQLVDSIDIKKLTQRISSKDNLDTQVEKILAVMADDFIKNTAEFACKLAKYRGSDTLDKDDVKFAIERHYNIQMPLKPAGSDKPLLSTLPPSTQTVSTSNYKQNLSLVKKANESNQQ